MALDIDRYAHVDSLIQRWDPRFKIAALGLLIAVVATLKTLPVAVGALVIAWLLIFISALPVHFVSHGLSFVVIFLLPFFVVMPFTYPGQSEFHVLGLPFALEGLRMATLIFLKAMTVVLLSFVIFGSARFDVSMLALQRLKCPKILVQMLLFAYRYTFVFIEEMKRMHTSMLARGFVARFDSRTLRIFGHFVGTLLVRSFERTERVYKAMLSKGYQGELHSMVVFDSSGSDYVKAGMVVGVAVFVMSVDYAGFFSAAVQGWF